MYGWMGTILRVDLSRRKITKEPLNEDIVAKYIGGKGLNQKYIYDELKPHADPLGTDNKIIFGVGPCNGTIVPGSSRLTVTTKSPLSGFIGDSNSAASLSVELKYAGYDMVIIEGESDKPVYLWINNDHAELKDAGYLWGKKVQDTRMALENEIGDAGIAVVSIGPAGENLVKIACLIGDLGRACGRTGIGAVMGSKKLKSVVVRGTNGVRVANKQQLEKTVREIVQAWREVGTVVYESWKALGTSGLPSPNRPVKNYQQATFEQRDAISGKLAAENYFLQAKSCLTCPVPCDHVYVINTGPFAGTWGSDFQAGTLWFYGDMVGVKDLDLVMRASAISNDYGLDFVGMSGIIAFLMECFQRGILTSGDVDGLNLEWGNGDTILKLIDMTTYRKGFGAILADGVKHASEHIGRGSEKYAMHVKGLVLDTYDPRSHKGRGLAYAVANRGAEHCATLLNAEASAGIFGFDHSKGEFLGGKPLPPTEEEGKASLVEWYENMRTFENCMEMCTFGDRFYHKETGRLGTLANLFNAVTGFELTEDDIMLIGERVVNLGRAFNLREGLTRKDDTLPERFSKEKMPDGTAKGQTIDLERMIKEYYQLRGWDEKTGIPTRSKLIELDLKGVIDDLKLNDIIVR